MRGPGSVFDDMNTTLYSHSKCYTCAYNIMVSCKCCCVDNVPCRSDDMTGQFTLAALEEEEYPVTHRRVSDLEQGVSQFEISDGQRKRVGGGERRRERE